MTHQIYIGDTVDAPTYGITGATVIEVARGMAKLSGGSIGHYIGNAKYVPVTELQHAQS